MPFHWTDSPRTVGVRHVLLGVLVLCPVMSLVASAPPTPKLQAFDLHDVKLLDGPFKHATDPDREYLLKLEPDRLLAWFRKEAGLEPKARVYGGWESEALAGHTLGHYLSACALMYRATGDVRFRDRITYIVGELAACQRANGNGYVAAIPNGKRLFAEVARGDIRAKPFDLNGGWSPFYTIHKLLARLARRASPRGIRRGARRRPHARRLGRRDRRRPA